MYPTDDLLRALEAATREPASALHFTPVPVRARHDGWTEARQRRFVAALAATGQTGRAAALAGMTRRSAARLQGRADAAAFTAACRAASDFARRLRSARRGAAEQGSAKGPEGPERPQGPERPEDFRRRGSSLTETLGPSAALSGPARAVPPRGSSLPRAPGRG